MGDTNRVALRAVIEATLGTTPASPDFQNICHTGVPMNARPITVQSENICGGGTRGVKDLALLGFEIGEGFSFEFHFGAHDLLYESLFQSAWQLRNRRLNTESSDNVNRPAAAQITDVDAGTDTFTVSSGTAFAANQLVFARGFTNAGNNGLHLATGGSATTLVAAGSTTVDETPPTTAELHNVGQVGASGDIEAVTSGGNALTSTVLDFTTLGLAVGQWIKVGGTAVGFKFANIAANNGFCRISVIAANRLSFDVVPTGWAADNGASVLLMLFFGDYIRDGSTKKGITFEKAYQDLTSPVYEYFAGCQLDTYELGGEAQAKLTGRAAVVGQSFTAATTTRFASASTIEDNGFSVLHTGSRVARIGEGGAALASPNFVRQANFQIGDNLRRSPAWSVQGAAKVGAGDFAVSGSLRTYFENETLLAKVQNNTESSIDAAWRDDESQVLLFDVPRLKYESGAPDVPGRNEDVTLPLTFRGLEHETLGYTMHAQRFFYAPAS